MICCFDTETSGFTESRLLQLGIKLLDSDYKPVMQAALLVRPDGWQIEEGATKVHGITQDYALANGFPVDVVLGIWCGMATKADLFVGHNLEFDQNIIQGELKRAGWPLITKPEFCTMNAMQPICKIPPTPKMIASGRRDFKRPKLTEAYVHAFGCAFDGAHDAMADCEATAKLYQWLNTPRSSYAPPPPLPAQF